jgi:hypothetical protein
LPSVQRVKRSVSYSQLTFVNSGLKHLFILRSQLGMSFDQGWRGDSPDKRPIDKDMLVKIPPGNFADP